MSNRSSDPARCNQRMDLEFHSVVQASLMQLSLHSGVLWYLLPREEWNRDLTSRDVLLGRLRPPSARPREQQGHCAPERHATPTGESHSKPAEVGRDSHTETTVEAQAPAAAATVLAQSQEDLSSRWRWRWKSASTISGALDRTAGHSLFQVARRLNHTVMRSGNLNALLLFEQQKRNSIYIPWP